MDIKKHKYKGVVCSPPTRHTGKKKSTTEWCKGKVGLEHDWRWFHRVDHGTVFELPTDEYKKCKACGKHSYDRRYIQYKFGTALKSARISMGVTQAQLAEKLGVPQNLVSKMESNENSPSLATMERYADALGVELRVSIAPSERHYSVRIHS